MPFPICGEHLQDGTALDNLVRTARVTATLPDVAADAQMLVTAHISAYAAAVGPFVLPSQPTAPRWNTAKFHHAVLIIVFPRLFYPS